MSDATLIDSWLDHWEGLRARGEALSPGEYASRHLGGAPAALVGRFEALAAGLLSADGVLRGGPGADTPAAPGLEGGAEPAPGHRLVRRLGRGGYGEVWEAEGPGGVSVALKLVEAGGGAEAELRALELVRGVRHPHLLAVFAAWRRGPWVAVACELADRTLADRLREAQGQGHAGIPRAELLGYVREAAEGLDALHAAGVQHRDVKPSNLLLCGGSLKVGDYGLAKLVGDGTASHSGSMTPAYAAPEAFAGRTSPRSDVYSLAVAYFQLRTGRLPFAGTPLELMRQHADAAPDLSALPPGERAAVARALAKDPGRRWASCTAFADGLAGAAASRADRSGRPGRRARHLLGWATAAALLLACCALLAAAAARKKAGGTTTEPRPPGADPQPAVREPLVLRGHDAPVTRVAFALGGTAAVTGSDDTTVRVWGLPDGRQWHVLRGLRHAVHALAGSPDRAWVAAGGGMLDPSVWVWDAETGAEVCRLEGHTDWVRCVAFVPGGTRLVTAGFDGTVRVWDVTQKRQLLRVDLKGEPQPRLHPSRAGQVWALAILEGGRQALVGLRDGTVRRLDLQTGGELGRWRAHPHYVNALALSPDGASVVTACSDEVNPGLGPCDDAVRRWSLPDGRPLGGHGGRRGHAFALALLPGGRLVSAGSSGEVSVWEVATGRHLGLIGRHEGEAHSVAVSPDGRAALSGGRNGTARWWPLGGGEGRPAPGG